MTIYGLPTIDVAHERKVCIATPCSSGQYSPDYLASVWRARHVFASHNVDCTLNIATRNPDIGAARNSLVQDFLTKTKDTHLLFVDADQGWRAEDVIRMLNYQRDIICGAVPKKNPNAEGLGKYVGDYGETLTRGPYPTLLEVPRWGTGFMLIARSVFELLIAGDHVESYVKGSEESLTTEYDFFRNSIDIDSKSNRRRFSEDYSFCNLWRNTGGKIYVDTLCQLTHIGPMTFDAPTLHATLTELSDAAQAVGDT